MNEDTRATILLEQMTDNTEIHHYTHGVAET